MFAKSAPHPFRSSYRHILRLVGLAGLAAPVLTACGIAGADINPFTKFSEAAFGVNASPRVTSSKYVKKGGGRYMVGKPYKVAGRWYTPRNDPGYEATGTASWYGPNFHGRLTANGEIFDQNALTAAHPTLPLPSYVRVTNLNNRRSIIVRVNDRGPYARGRIIDLSRKAAQMLDYTNAGTAKVRVQYVGPAPLQGDDTRVLMASYNGQSPLESNRGTLLAFNSNAPLPAFPADAQAPIPAGPIDRHPAIAKLDAKNGASSNPGQPISLLSYAQNQGGTVINDAFAAASAIAQSPGILEPWQQSMDTQKRAVDVKLGVFSDPVRAQKLALAFSMLAAVEEKTVPNMDRQTTSLRLTYLKAGVTRQDVLELARRSGLGEVVFSN